MRLGINQLDGRTVGVERKALAFIEVKRDQVTSISGIDIGRCFDTGNETQASTARRLQQVRDVVGIGLRACIACRQQGDGRQWQCQQRGATRLRMATTCKLAVGNGITFEESWH